MRLLEMPFQVIISHSYTQYCLNILVEVDHDIYPIAA